VFVGAAAAVLALIVVLVYVSQYRNNVNAGNTEVKVLVATRVIEKGTPASFIARAEYFAPQAIVQKQVLDGAITDPASIAGRVTTREIEPNQQLTLADFSLAAVDTLPAKLVKTQRAVSFPIDSAHGLVGQLAPGDYVDVYGLFSVDSAGACGSGTVIKLLMQNALILRMPGTAGGGLGGAKAQNIVLRASYHQAANIALTADAGTLYLTARPSANAAPTPPQLQTVQRLLLGAAPVTVASRCGALR
jgi:Flp pilus assembly protein CpaB